MARNGGGGSREAAALRTMTAGTREAGDEQRYIRHDNSYYYVNGARGPPTGSLPEYPRATPTTYPPRPNSTRPTLFSTYLQVEYTTHEHAPRHVHAPRSGRAGGEEQNLFRPDGEARRARPRARTCWVGAA